MDSNQPINQVLRPQILTSHLLKMSQKYGCLPTLTAAQPSVSKPKEQPLTVCYTTTDAPPPIKRSKILRNFPKFNILLVSESDPKKAVVASGMQTLGESRVMQSYRTRFDSYQTGITGTTSDSPDNRRLT